MIVSIVNNPKPFSEVFSKESVAYTSIKYSPSINVAKVITQFPCESALVKYSRSSTMIKSSERGSALPVISGVVSLVYRLSTIGASGAKVSRISSPKPSADSLPALSVTVAVIK